MNLGFLLRQAGLALVIASAATLVGVAVNALRPEPLPWVQNWDETLAARAREELAGKLGSVDLEAVQLLLGRDKVIILDARPADFYVFEHIPGARSLPVDEADRLLPDLLDNLAPDVRIVTYCESVTCPDSRRLGLKILEAGHPNVSVFMGGIEEWISRGLRVEGEV